MLLQADPTIQYLLAKPKRLLFKDLENDSPYNTYKFVGLPPTPINNPSIDVIKATLNPMKTDYIYMVAKGNGEHYFNETLNGHLRDKAKFDKVRDSIKVLNNKTMKNSKIKDNITSLKKATSIEKKDSTNNSNNKIVLAQDSKTFNSKDSLEKKE